MLTRRIAVLAMVIGVSAIAPQAILAQAHPPYTDPVRENFATQGCKDDQWETKGYASFGDCYYDYYYSYPVDPYNY